jgi:MYXO-CTERM domain-containing protein
MAKGLLRTVSGGEKHFRWRGREIPRLENLSDAVFGIAIAMLVVSSQVPESFTALKDLLREFVPFAIYVLLLGMVWHAHYTFFRRFGLQDNLTMLLNALLLFVVLFYLYPLKFLFTLLFNLATARLDLVQTSPDDADALGAIYSAGYAAVFGLLALFYLPAWRRRTELELTPVEELVTKQSLGSLLVHTGTALLALALSLLFSTRGLSGCVYFLIGPGTYAVGAYFDKRIDALTRSPDAAGSPVATAPPNP